MAPTLRALPTPQWHEAVVDGARVRWLEAGRGDPMLFLHGWGLTPRAYTGAIVRLCAAGVRVIAPSLPGFGGSTGLPVAQVGIDGYADRVAAFLDHLDPDVPVFVAGHSLGGGVGLRLAARRTDLVRSLTLVNSVGGAPSGNRGMSGRPWWRWALGAVTEASPRDLPRLLPLVVRDFVPNAARRPLSTAVSAYAALTADLADDARALVAAGLPVLFVWSDHDALVAPGAFGRLRAELTEHVVPGRHGWLLTEPDVFAETLRNALVVHAMLERTKRGQRATLAEDVPLDEAFPPERRRRTRLDAPSRDAT